MIKGFHIPGPVCGVSICSNPPHKKTKFVCLLSCLCKRAVEKTVDMQVSRKLIKLRLYYCYVTCHLVIMTLLSLCAVKPLVTSGFPSQGVTGVELWWSSVRRFHRRWIPHIKARLDVFLMFALTSYLTNNRIASELKSLDAYAMPLLCVICQSDIPHG